VTTARRWTFAVKAEARLGEELARAPKAAGAREPGVGKAGRNAVPNRDRVSATTLAEKGVDRKRAARAQKLAVIPKEKREEIAETLIEKGKAISRATIMAAVLEETKQEKGSRRCDCGILVRQKGPAQRETARGWGSAPLDSIRGRCR
jgi:hypothetical protein